MDKQVVVTEKPSVAEAIAKALGGFGKSEDVYESESYILVSAAGHLLEHAKPEEPWRLDVLPLIPENLPLVIKARQKSRLAIIEKHLQRSDVIGVINACDAGREGELIFQEISRYLNNEKPVARLWLQSMSAEGIRSAFKKLLPSGDVQGLADAADCRAVADWLIGINMSRALTAILSPKGAFRSKPAGRVQTPTLAMVVKREREIQSFSPVPYWEVLATFRMPDGEEIKASWKGEDGAESKKVGQKNSNVVVQGSRIFSKEIADEICEKITGGVSTVAVETKRKREQPKPLLKLNDLLVEANNRHGFRADRTQSIAQSLYEKKLITYPRTEYRHLRPEDDADGVRDRLQQIAQTLPEYAVVAKEAIGNGVDQSNSRVFDASKVGDHHAIIPDEIPQEDLRLSEDEQKVYSIVMKRFLAAFLPSAEKEETTVTFSAAGECFQAKESRLVVPGWRAVEGADAETSLQAQFDSLDGVTAFVMHAEADGKSTRPPARFTDATLLKAMEKAGRTVEDEDARQALKECGLGTAATRSGTIKKLLDDTYLQRAGREIYPTGQGMDLIDVVEKIGLGDLTNAEMTGQWENRLLAIEHGEASAPEFIKGIRTTTQRLVKQVKGCDVTDLVIEELADVFVPGTKVPMQSTLLDYVSADGDVRIPKFIRGRYLAVSDLRALFTDLIIGPLQGFVSKKTKKTYPACIRWLTEEKRCEVFFETDDTPLNDDEHPVVGSCYHCGSSIRERSDKYVCENAVGDDVTCQFRLGRIMCSRPMSRDDLAVMLKDGRTPIFDDFISKRNRPFKASLVISTDGKTVFEFPERRGSSRKNKRKAHSAGNI